jgi:hypothetical protein
LSLLSRLFRRSGRKQRGSSAPPTALATFSAQFPPAEWFNQRVVHLHSVGTQTVSSIASQHSVSMGIVRLPILLKEAQHLRSAAASAIMYKLAIYFAVSNRWS